MPKRVVFAIEPSCEVMFATRAPSASRGASAWVEQERAHRVGAETVLEVDGGDLAEALARMQHAGAVDEQVDAIAGVVVVEQQQFADKLRDRARIGDVQRQHVHAPGMLATSAFNAVALPGWRQVATTRSPRASSWRTKSRPSPRLAPVTRLRWLAMAAA